MNDIPVMFSDDLFMCAMYWRGWGGEHSVSACNGNDITNHNSIHLLYLNLDRSKEVSDHKDATQDDTHLYPMGSIMVKPGCTLYLYRDPNYSGER